MVLRTNHARKSAMNRFYGWLAGGVTVLTLASCSTPSASSDKAEAPANTPAPTNQATTTPTTSATKGFMALQRVVATTKAAVEAGNFEQAKAAFEHFEASWQTVEDGVKTKDATAYTAIEDAMDEVNQGLKVKHQAQVLTDLQTLTKQLATAAKA